MPNSNRPEVLAPAGDVQSLRAALAAGADAVYFGLDDGFNARAKAAGVSREMLPAVVAEVHRAGARAYLTLNTLVFEGELPVVEALLRDVAASGVDALIVQDPAVALLAKAVCPGLELHASTQMTISSPEGVRFAQGLGCTRVVLPRELSVKEIRRLRAGTDVELEVFVHGALCMAWSGQCLTSEAWGGRSANRGKCAQSCRMPYDLIIDGVHQPLGDVRYLLSPLDLAGVRAVPELIDIGVHTLKIEGRYKGPAYVVSAVEAYQRWIDAVQRGATAEDEARVGSDLAEMATVYSRGFSDGFLGGDDHQHLVEGRFPKHRGLMLGQVVQVSGHEVVVAPHAEGRPRTGGLAMEAKSAPIHERGGSLPVLGGSMPAAQGQVAPRAGMGVVFDDGHPEQSEQGGPIFAVESRGDGWVLTFGRPGPDLRQVAAGQRVWLTGNPVVERRARKLVEAGVSGRWPVRLEASGALDAALVVVATMGSHQVTVHSEGALAASRGVGLDDALLRDKLGAFGGTPFVLLEVDCAGLPAGLHLPVSALKRVRRALVAALLPLIERGVAPVLDERPALERLSIQSQAQHAARAPWGDDVPRLIPLCRTSAHLDAVLASGLPEVELDWMERVGLSRAVARARAAGLRVHVATPRVQKPGEEGFDRRIAGLEPQGVLVRHWGAAMHFLEHPEARRPELHGDFSLNVTNSLTAAHLLSLGLDTLTVAHDLDSTQLMALLERVPADRLTVAVHHHIPTFHTEHCVYSHLMSNGRDITDCGTPCQDHEIGLRDHLGQVHPVVVDPACRNTVYNAKAQSAAALVPQLMAAGVRRFRVEFVRETTAEALRVLTGYGALLAGSLDGPALIKRLRVHEQFGVTQGTMRVIRS